MQPVHLLVKEYVKFSYRKVFYEHFGREIYVTNIRRLFNVVG
jgi:hypothetical protein